MVGWGYISPEFGKSTKALNGYGEYVVKVSASKDVASLTIEAVAFDASLGSASGYDAAESEC